MVEPLPSSAERLARARNIWIATVRPDGRPHLVPVWFVWTGDKLYACISPRSVKGRNLTANPNVALALEDGTRPVICEGRARLVDRPWPAEVVRLFEEKYDWQIAGDATYSALVEVTPRKWLAW